MLISNGKRLARRDHFQEDKEASPHLHGVDLGRPANWPIASGPGARRDPLCPPCEGIGQVAPAVRNLPGCRPFSCLIGEYLTR